ncbi:MAG: acyl-coenzyme A thioesterase PaaI-like protein [Paracoccaceae bacterium]|jgi:acyl-coenzyme A thioesterase PaaI-like protein
MRPMMLGDMIVSIDALSNGRRMAVTRAEFRSAGSEKLAATATCSFAYLED